MAIEDKSAGKGCRRWTRTMTLCRQWPRELVEKNRIGETADNVWRALTREHEKPFPAFRTSRSCQARLSSRVRSLWARSSLPD